jgi:putative transposase
VSAARFIADQRTFCRVPHTLTCEILGVSASWLYKWLHHEPTERQCRRAALDKRVRELFDRSQRTYGSPRIHADLIDEGWRISVNTVANSMRRQGLQGRKPKRRNGLTKQDKAAPKFPDLLRRDFGAAAPNRKGAATDRIQADEGKLYLASALDLCGRAIKIAIAVRGGRHAIDGVIFHTDRGSIYTANGFTALCRRLGIRQSMGRVGSCFDNAASEAFFSTLEHEVLSRHHFATKAEARAIINWCHDFYNSRRRHSSAGLLPPIEYEKIAAIQPEAA